MGVDLLLMPFKSYNDINGRTIGFGYTCLEVVRNSDMWREIRALENQPVPERFLTHFGPTYPDEPDYWDRDFQTSVDAYDKPLRWVFAGALASLRDYRNIPKESQDRAVWAYLEQLPPDYKVALYWC